MRKQALLLGVVLAASFLLGCIGGQQEQPGQQAANITPGEAQNAGQQAEPESYASEQEAVQGLEQMLDQMEEQALANTTGELA